MHPLIWLPGIGLSDLLATEINLLAHIACSAEETDEYQRQFEICRRSGRIPRKDPEATCVGVHLWAQRNFHGEVGNARPLQKRLYLLHEAGIPFLSRVVPEAADVADIQAGTPMRATRFGQELMYVNGTRPDCLSHFPEVGPKIGFFGGLAIRPARAGEPVRTSKKETQI